MATASCKDALAACWSIFLVTVLAENQVLLYQKEGKNGSGIVVPTQGPCCPPGNIWQCVGIFLFVTTGRGELASGRWRPGLLLNIG